MRKLWSLKSTLLISIFLIRLSVAAQSGYKLPPQSIVDLVNAPSNTIELSNSANYMVTLTKAEMLSIEQLSEPRLGLAGYLINPENNANARKDGFQAIQLTNLTNHKKIALSGLPSNLLINNLQWSPDENYLAFQQIKKNGVELWAIEVKTGKAKMLTTSLLIDIAGRSFQWLANSNGILGQFVPANRGVVKPAPSVPNGPISLQNLGTKVANRTYQNLIASKHDEYLFDYYLTAQLKTVSLAGREETIGKPAIFRSFDLSPDNNYILKREIIKPYSYTSPAANFNSETTIIDLKGTVIKELKNGKYSAIRPTGPDATVNGPRNQAWRPDQPLQFIG